jgi:uncharacterized protein with PQ loop repeat
MENLASTLEVLSMTGTVLTGLTCLSPLPSVYSAYKQRKLDGVDVEYLFLSKVMNFAWLIYEFTAGDIGAIPCSLFAYLVYAIYLLMCARVTGQVLGSIGQQLLTEALLLIGVKQLFDLDTIIQLTFVLTLACYSSPVLGLYTIVKERQPQLIDLNISGAVLISSSVWACYFYLKEAKLLALANVLGIMFGAVQLAAYIWLRSIKHVKQGKKISA